jgi:hypothetical protein
MKTGRTDLTRPAVDWYTNRISAVLIWAAITFLLLLFRVGPVELLTAFAYSLTLAFVVLFASFLFGSDLIYRLLSST